MSAQRYKMVFVTVPNLRIARQLARAALKARAAACASLVPGIESHYWWRGKIERGAELLVLFKTTAGRVKALEQLVLARHPYDTPEFVVVPIGGNRRYREWLEASCAG